MAGARVPGQPRALIPVVALAVTAGLVTAAGPAPASGAAEGTGGGAVAGVVRLARRPPPAVLLPVERDPEVCGPSAPAGTPVAGPGGGVEGAVVLVEGVPRGRRPPGDLVLETVGCRFVPRVAAAMLGTRIRVKNSDPVLHNPRGLLGGPPVFNVALPGRYQVVDVTRRFARPGTVRVVCGVHPHMAAWLVLHDSPYLAVTDAGGAYRIEGLPPGTWTVRAWHPGLRPREAGRDGRPHAGEPRGVTRRVTVAPGTTITVDFDLR